MSLAAGTRLGPYEIVAPIGAGGMGEVYRARDTTLHREVAIKVLLDAVANDPDRLARFAREAQVLASLNHPNIAHIHGVEDTGGVKALVLELVEGEDLAQDRARVDPGRRRAGDRAADRRRARGGARAGGVHRGVWSPDGRTLYYLVRLPNETRSSVFAVDVASTNPFTAGKPRQVLPRPQSQFCNFGRCHDLAADGRFLFHETTGTGRESVTRLDLVLNWTAAATR